MFIGAILAVENWNRVEFVCDFSDECFINLGLFNGGKPLPQTDGEGDSVYIHHQCFSIINIK